MDELFDEMIKDFNDYEKEAEETKRELIECKEHNRQLALELEEQTEANKELNKVIITYKAMINEMAEELSNYLPRLDSKEEVIDHYFKKVSDNK